MQLPCTQSRFNNHHGLALPLINRSPFIGTSSSSGSSGSRTRFPTTVGQRLIHARQRSRLYIDFFGLGPSEIVVILVTVLIFYGPDRLSKLGKKAKDSDDSDKPIPEIWIREANDAVADMQKYASKARRKRAWDRINAAIEANDPVVMEKLAQLDVQEGDLSKLEK